jgi:hypothetical protein
MQKPHHVPIRLGVLPSAKVGQCPSSVPKHTKLVILVEKAEERSESALLKDIVSAFWTVAGNVSESPDGLFSNIQYRRRKEFDEDGHRASLDDDLRVVRCSGSDVGERPCSFELSSRYISATVHQNLLHEKNLTWIIE